MFSTFPLRWHHDLCWSVAVEAHGKDSLATQSIHPAEDPLIHDCGSFCDYCAYFSRNISLETGRAISAPAGAKMLPIAWKVSHR